MFNIFVELTEAGLHSIDGNVAAFLQPILMKNYPKVRKGMFVFPVNWFVQLCWNTVLKPLISSLQPDIEDKICPLYGDFRPQLFARFAPEQVEMAFGGKLDLALRQQAAVLDYQSISLDAILESERSSKIASVSALHAAQYLASEKLGRLHSDSEHDSPVQRRTHPESTCIAPDDADVKPQPTRTSLIGIPLGVIVVSFLISCNFCSWTFCASTVLIGMAILYYFSCDSYYDSTNSRGMPMERDTGLLLHRLEKEKYRENHRHGQDETGTWGSGLAGEYWGCKGSDGSTSPRKMTCSRRKSLVELGAGWLGEFSARCGI
jgi:hypothetical protein